MNTPHRASTQKHVAPVTPSEFDLDKVIDHIAHWLPTQGPIKDFIHHNTLHAVQSYPFHEGVAVAAKIFGARSYLPLADYQARYNDGRIKNFAIDWAIAHSGCDAHARLGLRQSLFKQDDTCHYPPVSLANNGIRNAWLTALEVNLNALVHPIVFRFLANFLDQGISRWTMTQDGESFWNCVWQLTHNSLLPLYPFNQADARAILEKEPDEAIGVCLQRIVGAEDLFEQYLLEMLLAHPGWAGMVRLIELNPKALLAPRQISLKQMIALELACELAFLIKKRGPAFNNVASSPLAANVPMLRGGPPKPDVPLHLRIWHEAMEFSLHAELLQALKPPKPPGPSATSTQLRPIAQALFCIDDRECSLRRHLEEINPRIETLGAAGFFGIDFLYQGLDDAYPVAQCPVIVKPKHLIRESSLQKAAPEKESPVNDLAHMHFTPHSLFRGWLFTQTLGLGYAVRLALNVFRPGSQLLGIRTLSEVDAHTHLHLVRESEEPTADGYLLGFSYKEMADRIEGLLRNIGLTQNFAPVIVVVAHGSSSVNNPHFAAYDCGACSGKPGAPNARAFARMANDEPVRALLRQRGIDIPATTRFVAALHNTSKDEITYFDPQLLEDRDLPELAAFQTTMDEALLRNAAERCRWFELGPSTASVEKAQAHVRARAASIFEPRPELNHSNNLYCIIGRRTLTRGLFLDRRAFLHSYDPASDQDGSIIVKILSAVIPVCGGINLEYLFSRIDNSVYGAGSKLPHNVIGLLGVANGVEGDLRTGLPSQMIEVHEPARLLIVIEQSREVLDRALKNLGDLKEWLDNSWVRLATCDPNTREQWLYTEKGWEPIHLPQSDETPSATHSEAIFSRKGSTLPVHILTRANS